MVVEIANRVLGVGCYDWKIIAMNIMSVDAVTDERPIFYEAIVQCHGRLRVCRNNGAADDKRSERCVMDSVAYHTEVKPDKARALAAASESAEGLAMAQCLQRLGYDRQDVRTSGLKPVASASRATTVAAPPTTATAPAGVAALTPFIFPASTAVLTAGGGRSLSFRRVGRSEMIGRR